ncbi:MAG TPA: MBL fold metallo-hydrolase [Candidatus Dormibacteraeota bacterium]|jgi:L-ascorbate metabolism protein UlaG (beta-lactamase superfamily)
MRLAARFAKLAVRPRAIAYAWLGQAGYLMKTSAGLTVMIDPYFSDEVEKLEGHKRVFPPPITADELRPDVLLVSHGHLDHFDEPTISSLASSGGTLLVAPASCISRAKGLGWPASRVRSLEPGRSATKGGLRITATFARHTWPDAIGFLLDIDGLRLWHSGDTEYDQRLRALATAKIDVAFICINGGGGNMNAHEAALLASELKPRTAVPMHYGLWAAKDYRYGGAAPDATPDPKLFESTLRKLSTRIRIRTLEVGRIVTLS